MRRYPSTGRGDLGLGPDVANAPEAGETLSYLVSRAVGYGALVACATFVASQFL